jgi:hypothetical protein
MAIRICTPETYFDDTATYMCVDAPKYSVARLSGKENNDALDDFFGAASTLAGWLYWISRGCVVHPRFAGDRARCLSHPADRRQTSYMTHLN